MKLLQSIAIVIFLAFPAKLVIAQQSLCTPNPSKEAVAPYKYLLDMKGKKILSGQQDSPWGIDDTPYEVPDIMAKYGTQSK